MATEIAYELQKAQMLRRSE